MHDLIESTESELTLHGYLEYLSEYEAICETALARVSVTLSL
jgi:hypothetical protein